MEGSSGSSHPAAQAGEGARATLAGRGSARPATDKSVGAASAGVVGTMDTALDEGTARSLSGRSTETVANGWNSSFPSQGMHKNSAPHSGSRPSSADPSRVVQVAVDSMVSGTGGGSMGPQGGQHASTSSRQQVVSAAPPMAASTSRPPVFTNGRVVPEFPILPPQDTVPNQTFQTATQVQSILSLPTSLLLHLARTTSNQEQVAIASSARAASYLSAMALPPPSPTQLVTSISGLANVPITTIGDHPAIPILLGQVFCPPTPGIPAMANLPAIVFEPFYSSVEDWSVRVARERVAYTSTVAAKNGTIGGRPALVPTASYNEREVATVAHSMKMWALKEQEQQVQQQVTASKTTAVILASHAAARSTIIESATMAVSNSANNVGSAANVAAANIVVKGGPAATTEIERVISSMDLAPYAEGYRRELDVLASGYFAQLHREALNRLMSAAESSTPQLIPSASSIFPTSQPPSTNFNRSIAGTVQSDAMHVQAAAAAAVAAGILAAKEMSRRAGSTIVSLGFDVSPLVPAAPPVGLASLEIAPETIAIHQARVPEVQAQRPHRPPRQHSRRNSLKSASPVLASSITTPLSIATLISTTKASQTCTPEKRDYLLAYAHTLYARDPSSHDLIALLHMLESIHPQHLPTLLLMSCVYYTKGELERSYVYNEKLLKLDPTYVEAMSNMGTTLRSMGRWQEAESWWMRAIELRPTYWDATENLLGVLCNASPTTTVNGGKAVPTEPRFRQALTLCEFVEVNVYSLSPVEATHPLPPLPRPLVVPPSIPLGHIHRLQNLFYAKGNLYTAMGNTARAADEYEKSIECVLSLPPWVDPNTTSHPTGGLSVRDLVVTIIVVAKLLATFSEGGSATATEGPLHRAAEELGLVDPSTGQPTISNIFQIVRAGGDAYVAKLLHLGGGLLPAVLLEPRALDSLLPMVFAGTGGMLPSLMEPAGTPSTPEADAVKQRAVVITKQTTSTMLLTLAKLLQDSMGSPGSPLSIKGLPTSPSLLLALYYFALALYPSPSTCNNLGILLSTMNATVTICTGPESLPVVCSGQMIALRYYQVGLQQDPKHPHLYTNLGSLLKDMGQLPQAVAMYKQAVDFNPTFDVALANLANAIKDSGQIEESIPYYRRAVEISPGFPEAICGLVNALGGICNWSGRGGVGNDWTVDNFGKLFRPSIRNPTAGGVIRTGYMGQIAELIDTQLAAGMSYGAGIVRQTGDVQSWLELVAQAIYDIPASDLGTAAEPWEERFSFFINRQEGVRFAVNEGGFVIRLIERLTRRIQRRWYIMAYEGAVNDVEGTRTRIKVVDSDKIQYRRPILPPTLPATPVPTCLPFHTFSYPVSARETRLISHRTGLRISHSTLNQPWLPAHVYPPPPPPRKGKLRIGYVSSDFGNHPLSHLMQSVFGLHDPARFEVFCYATSMSDGSSYRLKVEKESQHFLNVSAFTTQEIVEKIVEDGIHILINLSGYTKGARNEVFAARPAPVQMSYMGFAGTLAAGWCDYFIVDPIVCPPSLVSGNQWRLLNGYAGNADQTLESDSMTDFEGDPDPESLANTFLYTEKLMYLPHSYFVTDHKQAWREEPASMLPDALVPLIDDGTPETAWAIEEDKRWRMRRELFPTLAPDVFIFACWNQLYKIDPFCFRLWLNILTAHPKSILWLLRFPKPGELHLRKIATEWAGSEVADRIYFTDVAHKDQHIHRGRVADLFLDTTEVNAHTTAADILWSGTPILTYPRYLHKMCSRVATSIALATGFGPQMIVASPGEYEARAIAYAQGLSYDFHLARSDAPPGAIDSRPQKRGRGALSNLRKGLFLSRETSPLFDTQRWVRNMEKGLVIAWERWASGTEFEDSAEWSIEGDKATGCIFVSDDLDGMNLESRKEWFQ